MIVKKITAIYEIKHSIKNKQYRLCLLLIMLWSSRQTIAGDKMKGSDITNI